MHVREVTREQEKLPVRKRTPRLSHPASRLTSDPRGQLADKRISPSATRWSNNSVSDILTDEPQELHGVASKNEMTCLITMLITISSY